MKGFFVFLVFTVFFTASVSTSQSAIIQTFDFQGLTNNSDESIDIGIAQIFLDVSDPGPAQNGTNQAMFTFRNIGPESCSLAEIYFDDGSLLGIASIIEDSPDVDFKQDKIRPKNLPGANLADPGFEAIASFSLEPDNPEPFHGVNPGEQVSVIFTLNGANATVNTVLDELHTGDLRIGIHMKAFDNGESDSFINNLIPEPATLILLGIGFMFLKRFRHQAKQPY